MSEGWQRHVHKRDANEPGIVMAFRKLRCVPLQCSPPAPFDLLVGYRHLWIPVEVKNAEGRADSKGRTLTASQVAWVADCKHRNAPYAVVWNLGDVQKVAAWLAIRARGEEWPYGSLHFERPKPAKRLAASS